MPVTTPSGGEAAVVKQTKSRTAWLKWRNLLLLLSAAAVLGLVRQPILTGVAWILIVDEPQENPAAVWIRDSDPVTYDAAARA